MEAGKNSRLALTLLIIARELVRVREVKQVAVSWEPYKPGAGPHGSARSSIESDSATASFKSCSAGGAVADLIRAARLSTAMIALGSYDPEAPPKELFLAVFCPEVWGRVRSIHPVHNENR